MSDDAPPITPVAREALSFISEENRPRILKRAELYSIQTGNVSICVRHITAALQDLSTNPDL